MANWNELHDLCRDIEAIQFLGGGNAVVAVQNVVFIIDFVKFDRRQGFAFPHGSLDADHAVRRHVTFGCELTVKIEAFPDTADNLFERYAANSSVDEVEGAVAILDLAKAFRFAVPVIGPQFFNDTPQVNHDPLPEDVIQKNL